MTESNNPTSQNNNQPQQANSKAKKKSSGGLFIIVIALALIAFMITRGTTKEINWQQDYDKAFELAKQENKPLLLSFNQASHAWCINMRKRTYTNSKAKEFVEKNFIPVMIYDHKRKDLFDQYKIGMFPTQVVCPPEKTTSQLKMQAYPKILGDIAPSEFIEKLTKGAQKVGYEFKP